MGFSGDLLGSVVSEVQLKVYTPASIREAKTSQLWSGITGGLILVRQTDTYNNPITQGIQTETSRSAFISDVNDVGCLLSLGGLD